MNKLPNQVRAALVSTSLAMPTEPGKRKVVALSKSEVGGASPSWTPQPGSRVRVRVVRDVRANLCTI